MDFSNNKKKKKKIASKALRVCSIKQEGQAPMKYYDLHRGYMLRNSRSMEPIIHRSI